ncbi:unnamed protein product, partial [Rotaria sp. Silwood1]
MVTDDDESDSTTFFCALAHKTGGEYLPMINAARILSSIILNVLFKEDTLCQLFRHINVESDLQHNCLYNYTSGEQHVSFMIEHCSTMFDIRQYFQQMLDRRKRMVTDDDESDSTTYIDDVQYAPSDKTVHLK